MADNIKTEITRAITRTLGSSLFEIGELVADKVRYLRWKSAIKTLEKAKEFSKKYGGLKNAPPLKFFLPFMENCSLEDEDEDIVDMWARLLVMASIDFKPGHLLFMRTLREITGAEARLLEDIAHSNYQKKLSRATLKDAIPNWEMFSAYASPLRKIDISSSWSNSKSMVRKQLELQGIMLEHLGLYGKSEVPEEEVFCLEIDEMNFYKHDIISMDILVSLNLVQKIEQRYYQEKGNWELYGVAFCLTAMGASFFIECSSPELFLDD